MISRMKAFKGRLKTTRRNISEKTFPHGKEGYVVELPLREGENRLKL